MYIYNILMVVSSCFCSESVAIMVLGGGTVPVGAKWLENLLCFME